VTLAMRTILALLVAALSTLVVATPARAQDARPRITAQVSDREVYAGQPFQLHVIIENAQDPPAPDLGSLERRFDVRRLGRSDVSSHQTTIINGRRRDETQHRFIHRYQLTATSAGTTRIPALVVTIDGRRYTTTPIGIRVLEPQETDDVKLRIAVEDDSPFVGEPVEVTFTWLIARNVSSDFSFTLSRPDGAFELYDAPRPDITQRDLNSARFMRIEALGAETMAEQGQAQVDGRTFTTLAFKKLLVPRRSGARTLGPALVNCEIEIGRRRRGIFGDEPVYDTVVAPSNEVALNVRPLPEEGRPSGFNGVVGPITLRTEAAPTQVNVGDPIELMVRIQAPPPIERIDPPDLAAIDAFTENFRLSDDVPEIDRDAGSMTLTTVVRAADDDVERLPSIEIPYFDPNRKRYEIARSAPISLEVRPTQVVTLGDAVGDVGPAAGAEIEEQRGGLAANFTTDEALVNQAVDWDETIRSPVTIGLAAGPPAVYLAAAAVGALRRRAAERAPLKRSRGALGDAVRTLRTVGRDGGPEPAGEVSGAVREYIARRFDKPAPSLTPEECARLLHERGVEEAQELRAVLERCDAARFAGASEPLSELAAHAEALLRQADRRLGRRG